MSGEPFGILQPTIAPWKIAPVPSGEPSWVNGTLPDIPGMLGYAATGWDDDGSAWAGDITAPDPGARSPRSWR